jgi:acyl-coenzyme A thioesterase PaaI-like protein
MIPYSGSIKPEILEVTPGHVRIRMRDRRKLRNHLKSLHAVALMNVCEMVSGMALDSAIPPEGRIILKAYRIEFLAKARGSIVAESRVEPFTSVEKRDFEVEAVATDEAGTVVCRAHATWRVGPKKKT